MSTIAGEVKATRLLARHAASLRYEALPHELVELTKQCVLDTLGVSIGATTIAPEAAIVAEYVRSMGGAPQSTLLGFGGKAPAAWAAFVNGSLGHMLDYDDLGDGSHVSIATVPVAFAICDKLGGMSGRDFIAAVAAGTDVHSRIAKSIDIPDWTIAEGWFATQLIGYLSGAATAGRLLGLDEERMDNAFGIGFNQMGGSRQMAVGAATHMRSMQAGFSGQAATLAAELAQRGIIGDKEALEGRYGLYRTYVRTGTPNWNAITDGLGIWFPLLESHGFKVWPACAYTRPTNAAVLQLRKEHQLRPQDVQSITVSGGTGGTRLLSEPIELKRRPRSSIDGKYSIPFTTAVMMTRGNVTLRDYTEEGLRDPAVLAMADKVSYRALPGQQPGQGSTSAASIGITTVEIRTNDGRTLSCTPMSVPGDPCDPVDPSLLEAKFRDCVSFSAQPIPARDVDRIIELVGNLEKLPDVTEITRLLA
jgi:2-methylcitrate dehydratase PrpD